MTAGDWFACFVAGWVFVLLWVGFVWVVCLWWDGLCFLLDYCFVYLDLLIVLIFCDSFIEVFCLLVNCLIGLFSFLCSLVIRGLCVLLVS